MPNDDYLQRNINSLPYFRGFLRAIEARFYQKFQLDEPVLDLGCGDGQFVEVTFKTKLSVGIDPWTAPVQEAAGRDVYDCVLQTTGDSIPFEDGHFATIISNSVLEHIPDLDPVIQEAARVLKSNGLFLFCVPNHQFLSNLSISSFFDRCHLRFLGNAYRRFFNRISRHHHCDSPEVWSERLLAAGFVIEEYWHYFSPKALHTLEWGHYFGLPSWILHAITGKWILAPQPWNLWITRKIVQRFYDEDAYHQPQGSYTFYVARKSH